MKMLTKEILAKLPPLGTNAEKGMEEVKVIVKFFNPIGAGAWYITEYDPAEELAYGFANLGDPQCAELGYIYLPELFELVLPMGLKIERDMHFGDHTLKEVFDTVKSGGHI